ncbi:putative Mg2+ transporter-C (MgtC) family protein [Leucobacter luti]|uniref:MgtC/SapB family protein n=1 Tax=Leucobacter luti TaxID=340320 RepID=UPI00104DE414|nr:MgtC/SapB family protein [Leucobacter luti]MCW2289074.1 putative Mg2+ transporter-C (MgtC) family protein [Leucobacter luti]TCK35525.1 putative Mg2+ transporter-C (MgtC) family protein [Leucobacter luti]
METLDLAIRILAGVTLGAAIGFERQMRSRTAGLRTNALVSLGAALFVIMGAFSFEGPGADPTRVAAQVVSGIGFLGAGVIMRQGASVSGLNTAATLWASAAVGALAGGGMILVAVGGTAAIMLSNVVLRPLGRLLDRRGRRVSREAVTTEYVFVVRSAAESEVPIRSRVVAALQRPEFTVHSLEANDLATGEVELTARLTATERSDAAFEAAIADVVPVPEVTSVRWRAREFESED